MNVLKILFILIIIFHNVNCSRNSLLEFIAHYLNYYNINNCYFFTCWAPDKIVELNKILGRYQIRYSYITTLESLNTVITLKKNLTLWGYVLDISCEYFENTLKIINRVELKLTRPWLIITNVKNTQPSYWREFFSDTPLRLDSNIKIAITPDGNWNNITILEVYNLGYQLGGSPIVNQIGEWNGGVLNITEPQSFYEQRSDLRSLTLRSTSVILQPNHTGTFEEYMLDSRYPHLDTMSRYHYPFFTFIRDFHQFNFNLTMTDRWFGDLQSGVDGGVAQLLFEDRVDVATTGGSLRPKRCQVLDFLIPSYHFRPCFIFRNPGVDEPFNDKFLKPFENNVWGVTALFAIGICIFIKFIYNIESKIFRQRTRYSCSSALLLTLAAFFQQGSSSLPSHVAGRFLCLILLIFSILIYNYYTSSILFSLLSSPPPAFNTFHELAFSKLEMGIENLPYTLSWFVIKENDSDVSYAYKKKIFPSEASGPRILLPDEGIALVKKGGFAYHTQLDTGYPIIARTFDQEQICDITKINMIPETNSGVMIQKWSQYYELFHITLRKAKTGGLVQRVSTLWESKKPECFSSAIVKPVDVDEVFIAFFLLVIGMIIAMTLLLMEVVWDRYNLDLKMKYF